MRLRVHELHHLMLFPRQLSPAAGLLGILLDRLQHLSTPAELNHPQPPAADPLYANLLIAESNVVAGHHLCGHRSEDFCGFSQIRTTFALQSPVFDDQMPNDSCENAGRVPPITILILGDPTLGQSDPAGPCLLAPFQQRMPHPPRLSAGGARCRLRRPAGPSRVHTRFYSPEAWPASFRLKRYSSRPEAAIRAIYNP
jgi:hypothetical protein